MNEAAGEEGLQAQHARVRALQESLSTALKSAFHCCRWEEFRQSFATFPEHQAAALYDLYQQVLLNIRANSEAEFLDICEENQLWDKLKVLEQLVEEQTSLNTGTGVLSKRAEVEKLQQLLDEMQQAYAEAAAELVSKQKEVMAVAERFTPVTTELDQVHVCSKRWAKRSSVS